MLLEGFVLRMKKLLVAEFDAFAASYDRPRNVGLRRNPQKGAQLVLPEFGLTPVPWCADGFYYDAAARPGLSPLHEAGCYYLQEPSAMAPAELLDVEPGMRVLDLCAAPGGKSTQLAAKLAGCGLLVCNEIHPKRAQILAQNIERMGIANALVLNEHPKNLSPRFDGYFDRVLVDAPCSGEGMFRKEEAAVADWSEETVAMCAARQIEILRTAASLLRPGGRLCIWDCAFDCAYPEPFSVNLTIDLDGEILHTTYGICKLDGQSMAQIAEICKVLHLHPLRAEKSNAHFYLEFEKAETASKETQKVG